MINMTVRMNAVDVTMEDTGDLSTNEIAALSAFLSVIDGQPCPQGVTIGNISFFALTDSEAHTDARERALRDAARTGSNVSSGDPLAAWALSEIDILRSNLATAVAKIRCLIPLVQSAHIEGWSNARTNMENTKERIGLWSDYWNASDARKIVASVNQPEFGVGTDV